MRRAEVVFVMLLTLTLVGLLPVRAQEYETVFEYEPVFEEVDCFFPEFENVICGVLIVPEDRSDPDGNQVELAVAILLSLSDDPAPEPVIYLEGGPGGSALLGIEGHLKHPVRAQHDLILIDQRGTGFSSPSLNCPEMETEEESGDPVADCRDRLLAEGINLAAYTSAASAADINDLRIALGYEQVNLYGVSYGTRLALTVMRDYPEGVRAVILDSVYPPEIDDIGLTPESFVGALEALFALCAEDATCSAVFPDLADAFYEMIELLNESPVTLDGEDTVIDLSGDEVLTKLFLALYDTERIPFIPYALYLLAYGEEEDDLLMAYLVLAAGVPGSDEEAGAGIIDSDQVQEYINALGDIDQSEGMGFSVDCAEEYQLNDVEAAFAAIEAAPAAMRDYLISNVEGQLANCETWGVPTADAIEAERVFSDIPTLLLSGGLDPVTPPSSGDSAALGLSNSQHVVFPTAGHAISFSQTLAGYCAQTLVISFLETLDTAQDTSCVDETAAVEFFTGD